MRGRPACQILSKALDISSATAGLAPDLLKVLAILSETTVRRSKVDPEDLCRSHLSMLGNKIFQENIGMTKLTRTITHPNDFRCQYTSHSA